MLKRLPDLLTYAVAAMLAFVFAKEAIHWVAYDVMGVKIPVLRGSSAQAAVNSKSLKVMSYNVLVSAIGLDRRVEPLFKILKESDADIMALQEVGFEDGWFMRRLEKEEWAKAYYRAGREPDNCNGQFIISKLEITSSICYGLPGPQGRTVLIAVLKTETGPLTIATTHMESPLESGAVRAKQLDTIFAKAGVAGDAIVLGDFNFGDGEPEEGHLDPAYKDMWLELRPKEKGYTWDNEKSDLAAASKFAGEKSRRLDRILLRSATWKAKSIEIIGDIPTDEGKKDMFPSDHFGLLGEIAR